MSLVRIRPGEPASITPPLRALPLGQGAPEPVLETRLTKARVIAGDEGAFAKCRAEVARLRISDNLAPIVVCLQAESDERVEPELFRSPDFNRAVYRRTERDPADRFGDVVSRDRLNECDWHPDRVAVGGAVGDAGDEFKELRRADDRVGDRRLLDHFLLNDFRGKVAAFSQSLGTHHRQRDVMFHAGGGLTGKDVAG